MDAIPSKDSLHWRFGESLMTPLTIEYKQDFYGWINHNLDLLRQGKLAEINVDTLIDELESMANRDQPELVSHLIIWTYPKIQFSQPYIVIFLWIGNILSGV